MNVHRLTAFGRNGLVLGAIILGVTATGALAAVKVKKDLTATSSAPDARGVAKLVLKTASNGRFSLVAHRLPPGRRFDVIVRGVKVGTMQSNAAGAGKIRLSTRVTPTQGLLGFDPRGAQLTVRDDGGDDDLVGDIPDDSDSAEAACCFQSSGDDNESECEDLTAMECAAANGTPGGTASCIPDPCGPPTGAEKVCCTNGNEHDEEAEAECEVTTEGECAAAHGMVVNATSCDANPCAATPPAQTVVCCVPDDDGAECEILTPEHCMAENGTPNTTATSCQPDTCGGSGGGGGDDGGGEDGGD